MRDGKSQHKGKSKEFPEREKTKRKKQNTKIAKDKFTYNKKIYFTLNKP